MDPMDTDYVDEEQQHNKSQITSPERSLPDCLTRDPTSSAITVPALAGSRIKEICNDLHEDLSTETYSVELLRRAIMQGDHDARVWVQRCLSEVVFSWLHRHPSRELAYRMDSEEHYVARAFERFWQISTFQQQTEITSLHAALHYLQVSLNSVILDTLRAYLRSGEFPLSESSKPDVEDGSDRTKIWRLLQSALPNVREQRLAYLLFHSGLTPRKIVRFCTQEFNDIHEIYRLRRNIVERLLHNMVSNQLI